jgi:hypothetical protein
MHWVVGSSRPHHLAADAWSVTPLGSPTVKQTIRPNFHELVRAIVPMIDRREATISRYAAAAAGRSNPL